MKLVKIYELIDPFTNEIRYIGKTIRSLDERLKYHIQDAKYSKYTSKKVSWIKSLLNYNEDPIIRLVEKVDKDEVDFWEQFYIELYKSWGFRLTNMTRGGDGIQNPSKEIRNKIRKSLKKTRGKGYKPWNYGLITSQSTKQKQSKAKNSKKKPVLQFDLNGNFVKEWSSLTEVSRQNNYDRSTISNVCLKRYGAKTAYGFKWEYKESA